MRRVARGVPGVGDNKRITLTTTPGDPALSTHWNQNSRFPLEPEGRRSKRENPPLMQRRWVPFAAVGVGMLLVGIGLGSSGRGAAPDAAPAPATTVTASPSPAPTVTKSVEVTPKSCLEALTLSEQGFTLSAEAMGYMNDALQAAGRFDVPGLQKANVDLEALNPKLTALTAPMKQAAFDCREGVR
jgi:hypothetical protein